MEYILISPFHKKRNQDSPYKMQSGQKPEYIHLPNILRYVHLSYFINKLAMNKIMAMPIPTITIASFILPDDLSFFKYFNNVCRDHMQNSCHIIYFRINCSQSVKSLFTFSGRFNFYHHTTPSFYMYWLRRNGSRFDMEIQDGRTSQNHI